MIKWLICKLQKLDNYLTTKSYRKYVKKREEKIHKLTIELWRESAVSKVCIDDLKYIQDDCERSGKEYVWIIEYYEKSI